MSNNIFTRIRDFVLSPDIKKFLTYIKRVLLNRWQLKLGCVFLALILWGVLISSDANVTREKMISNVSINTVGADTLQRNGLIVVSGLDNLDKIQMKVDVPQGVYNKVSATNYNPRIDLSGITKPGLQQLPISTTQSNSYGQVIWLSQSEITVEVEELITKRRVPLQLDTIGETPAGFYASTVKYEPTWVMITGPKSITEDIEKCIAVFDMSKLEARPGLQPHSVPFEVYNTEDKVVSSPLLTITSESIVLDSLIVEQRLYPMKAIDIDQRNLTSGTPKEGYYVASVTVSPTYLSVAGSSELLKSLTSLDVSTVIDIEGAHEKIVRQLTIEKPQNAEYMSNEAVFVTIEILPESPDGSIPVGKLE